MSSVPTQSKKQVCRMTKGLLHLIMHAPPLKYPHWDRLIGAGLFKTDTYRHFSTSLCWKNIEPAPLNTIGVGSSQKTGTYTVSAGFFKRTGTLSLSRADKPSYQRLNAPHPPTPSLSTRSDLLIHTHPIPSRVSLPPLSLSRRCPFLSLVSLSLAGGGGGLLRPMAA